MALGPGWYFNRDRWATWDGYAPYDVVWDEWRTVMQVRALDRLNLIRATATTQSAEQASAMIAADVKEATGG